MRGGLGSVLAGRGMQGLSRGGNPIATMGMGGMGGLGGVRRMARDPFMRMLFSQRGGDSGFESDDDDDDNEVEQSGSSSSGSSTTGQVVNSGYAAPDAAGGTAAPAETTSTGPTSSGLGSSGAGSASVSVSSPDGIGEKQAYDLYVNAGFSPDEAKTMTAIAMGESTLNPNARYDPPGPEDSYGLSQINMDPAYRDARLKQFGISSPEDLLDPATNARAAHTLYEEAGGFTPWSVYTSDEYTGNMDAVERALAGGGQSDPIARAAVAPEGSSGQAHVGGTELVGYDQKQVGAPVASALQAYEAQTGIHVPITDGYRTSAEQAALKQQKPGLAAPAGSSFHEQGLAIDVDPAPFGGYDTPEYQQFVQYMKSQGYTWGGEFSGTKEPWHFGFGE